jgi:hypothetical protein
VSLAPLSALFFNPLGFYLVLMKFTKLLENFARWHTWTRIRKGFIHASS